MTDPPHRYRGARALVLLHDEQLRRFVAVWRRARVARVCLGASDDPAYASLDALLRHVVGCARGYLTWTCEVLGLPDPGIAPAPPVDRIADGVDGYLDEVLTGWRGALVGVAAERFEEAYSSRWNTPFSVEAMLEHAVVHAMRHSLQLEERMTAEGTSSNGC